MATRLFSPKKLESSECVEKRVPCPVCGRLKCLCRPRFFAGQLLTEDDLNALDRYMVEKNKLHNRQLHGWGVVCGLEVVCHECPGWVTVKEGYAIDPCGNDIVVCKDHEFNLIEAIRECRRRPTPECHPWTPPKPRDCKDPEEVWCVTIRYHEWETRPVNPLLHKKPRGCGCCDGSRAGCGCCCHTTNGESVESSARTAARTPPVCEPTRVCEGYRLEVAGPKQEEPSKGSERPQPGTLAHKIFCCRERIQTVYGQAPRVVGMTAQQAHAACCRYRQTVSELLDESELTRCELREMLARILCPDPPAGLPAGSHEAYLADIHERILQMRAILRLAYLDCRCLSLLPSCPPEVSDDRLCLACVTVRGDRILRICNFDCRRVVVSFPALAYWLSVFPFGEIIRTTLRDICCEGLGRFSPEPRLKPNLSFDPTNAVESYQSFAAILKSVSEPAMTEAERPGTAGGFSARRYLNRETEVVSAELSQRGVEHDVQSLDALPGELGELTTRFTAATLPADEPVVVYTKGDLVVGMAPLGEAEKTRRVVSDVVKRQAELENVKSQLETIREDVRILKERGPK